MNKQLDNKYFDIRELENLAKNGDMISRNKLLEQNIPLINRMAHTIYDEMINIYIADNNIENVDDFIFPNNIVSLEDIIQDFYIKSIEILDYYININSKMYFSTFLNNNLSYYKKTYAKNKLNFIFDIYRNETCHNIDNSFNKFVRQIYDDDRKRDIMRFIENDNDLKKYSLYADLLFDGYTYKEMMKKTNLTSSELNQILKKFKSLYRRKLNFISIQNKAKQTTTQNIEFRDENFNYYLLPYNSKKEKIIRDVQIKTLIMEIRKGNMFFIKHLLNYYNDFLDIVIADIYQQISTISPDSITIEEVSNDFKIKAEKIALKYFKSTSSLSDDFELFFKTKLSKYKESYVRKYYKDISTLTFAARNGYIEAKKQLLEINVPLIKKIAIDTYNEIVYKYRISNNIENNDNFTFPDNLISLDDIIQDFCIKAINILDHYLDITTDVYFSQYINHMLSNFKVSYINNTMKRIQNIYDNEIYLQVDDSFNKLIDKYDKYNILQEIRNITLSDERLKKYLSFIDLIFEGYDWEEIKKITNLTTLEVYNRLMQFANRYKNVKDEVSKKIEIETIIKKIDGKDDPLIDIVYNYYDNLIKGYVQDAYEEMKKMDCDVIEYITFEKVLHKFQEYFNQSLLKYISTEYKGFDNFTSFIKYRFIQYKKSYIKKCIKISKQSPSIIQSNQKKK